MASESLLVSEVVPAAPREIFSAWLDTNTHSAFTGETANIEPFVGGSHSAFNGYATGRFVRLEKDHVIAATWRSTEFPDDAADSHIEVTLEETVGGTTLTLLHTDIPDGLAEQCRDAWIKYYLVPLRQHFAARADADNVDDEVRVVVTTEDPEEATDDLDDAVSETGNGGPGSDGRGSSRGRNGVASRAEVATPADDIDGDEDENEDEGPSARESERRSPRPAGAKTAEPTRSGSSDRSPAAVKPVRPAMAAKGTSKAETPARAKVAPPMQRASSEETGRTGKAASAAKMSSKAAPATKPASTSKPASATKAAPVTKPASATKAAATPKPKGAAAAGKGVKTKSVAGGRTKAKALAPSAKSRTAGVGNKPGRPAATAASGARAARPAKSTRAKAGKSRSAMTAAGKAARKPGARAAAKKTRAAAKGSVKAKPPVKRTPAKKTAKRGSRPRR